MSSPVASEDLVETVRTRLAGSGVTDLTPMHVAGALRQAGTPVGDATVLAVHAALQREVVGAGPLEPLLRTPGVTDVLVNGPEAVYFDRGDGLEPADVTFPDDAGVRRLAQRLAASGGRRLDDASPYVDVRLRDGTRCHAVLAPLARPGTVISLRIPARRSFTLAALEQAGTVPPAGGHLLRSLVRHRLALLISGGTGSGKTTLLATLLGEIDPRERIVVVEDATELRPDHPHVVGLEARPANIEGTGEIVLRDLVRQALRMRPDRLVVGEVRGAEVVDMLAALNTGHQGGCATVHANSATDVPARIEALALAAGLPRAGAHAQLASAIDAVVHLSRRDGRRQVAQISVPVRQDAGWVETVPAVTFGVDGSAVEGPGADRLADRLGSC